MTRSGGSRGIRRRRPVGVFYVANAAKIGGGNRTLMDILDHLDRDRFSPRLFVPGPGLMEDWGRGRGIPTTCLDLSESGRAHGSFGLVWRAARLALRMRFERVRIVHASAHLCFRAASLAGRLAGVRRVCHLGYPPGADELAWCLRFGAEAVIGCHQLQADEVRGYVKQAWPRCRVEGMPNGIDLALYQQHARELVQEELRQGADHVAVIVGHVSEVKGYPTFLRAAARVAEAVPGCRFLALGGETTSPGFRATMEKLADDLGVRSRIDFLGYRSDVASVLRASDVMVLPSLAEGLPLAILEAMATGLPVIATPVGGIAEAVIDGETGFLLPPGDADEIVRALVRLFRDPALAARMGAAGRRRAEERFSLARFMSDLHALYDELVAAGTAGLKVSLRA